MFLLTVFKLNLFDLLHALLAFLLLFVLTAYWYVGIKIGTSESQLLRVEISEKAGS